MVVLKVAALSLSGELDAESSTIQCLHSINDVALVNICMQYGVAISPRVLKDGRNQN